MKKKSKKSLKIPKG